MKWVQCACANVLLKIVVVQCAKMWFELLERVLELSSKWANSGVRQKKVPCQVRTRAINCTRPKFALCADGFCTLSLLFADLWRVGLVVLVVSGGGSSGERWCSPFSL